MPLSYPHCCSRGAAADKNNKTTCALSDALDVGGEDKRTIAMRTGRRERRRMRMKRVKWMAEEEGEVDADEEGEEGEEDVAVE